MAKFPRLWMGIKAGRAREIRALANLKTITDYCTL